MAIPYHIECIFKERKIVDLLENRGFVPARQQPGKLIYHCPLHTGDNDPSFVVYLNKEYQNYFCYGCSSGGNVINLLSAIDKISLREAAKYLIKGIDINEIDVISSLLKAVKEGIIIDHDDSIEELILMINYICKKHFEELNLDETEIGDFNVLFQEIDRFMMARDIDTLREVYNFLLLRGFAQRKKNYLKKQEKIFVEKWR
ncbi:hypothetical protein LCGC14_1675110 [marine sediment metagenome]|uniref:Zinc finger CHC2-type domain-containing protein n=1 Tax=marine sediment metagenome TaxID=412755 RepID=A0A0F9ICQ1_9ZZZZ